jgi:basic membrane protein A
MLPMRRHPRALLLVGLVLAALLSSCRPPPEQERAPGIRVGLVFDVGGLGDKSFNDAAYLGLLEAQQKLQAEIVYLEPAEVADREAGLRRLAQSGFDLMFGIGFIFTDDLAVLAREYPAQKFAGVDYTISYDEQGRPIPPPENLSALKFKEEEGSCLIGAICALTSKTGKIGFLGGMDIPLIHKFETGFKFGAKLVKPGIEILTAYAGVTPEAFKDPAKGKELSLGMYDSGADIIYHASGSTGLGLFEAAEIKDRLAVGVDADQWDEMPGHILTSMIKRVDVAVFSTVRDCQQGVFKGGIRDLGLKEDSVGYVYNDQNRGLIPAGVIERVEEIKRRIVGGELAVPDTEDELEKLLQVARPLNR